MKPCKVTFYVYAESEEDAKELQTAMNNFVRAHYDMGILVTARKLVEALAKFGNNFFVTNFLKR